MRKIILLHGAIGASDQMEPLVHDLKKRGVQCYSFNFSGHGGAPFLDEFGIEQFMNELENFMKLNDLIRPDVFGYSMGGYVALYLAKQKPELLGNIITLGTKFDWTPETSQKEIKQLDPKLIKEKLPKFADSLKRKHGNNWELLLQKTAAMMVNLGNDNLLCDLSEIENRTLIGLADKDSMVSVEETVSAYKQFKNGSMYMLPNTKHPIESVNVDLLASIISNTLSS